MRLEVISSTNLVRVYFVVWAIFDLEIRGKEGGSARKIVHFCERRLLLSKRYDILTEIKDKNVHFNENM